MHDQRNTWLARRTVLAAGLTAAVLVAAWFSWRTPHMRNATPPAATRAPAPTVAATSTVPTGPISIAGGPPREYAMGLIRDGGRIVAVTVYQGPQDRICLSLTSQGDLTCDVRQK